MTLWARCTDTARRGSSAAGFRAIVERGDRRRGDHGLHPVRTQAGRARRHPRPRSPRTSRRWRTWMTTDSTPEPIEASEAAEKAVPPPVPRRAGSRARPGRGRRGGRGARRGQPRSRGPTTGPPSRPAGWRWPAARPLLMPRGLASWRSWCAIPRRGSPRRRRAAVFSAASATSSRKRCPLSASFRVPSRRRS